MVFDLRKPEHRQMVWAWIDQAQVLLGMNLLYDLLYLRRRSPGASLALAGRHLLIDLAVVNYLSNELRPETSLKALGVALGAYSYDRTAHDRFPFDESLLDYNARDTHNTVLALSLLGGRIERDYPGSDKLSHACLSFYSDTLWSLVRMAEAGIPMCIPGLSRLFKNMETKAELARRLAESKLGVVLKGAGSDNSKRSFIDRLVDAATPHSPEPLIGHRLLKLTDKTRKISFAQENRNFLGALLPEDHPLKVGIKLTRDYTHATKLTSSYLLPLLRHRANDPDDRSSVLLPCTNTVGLAYPSWYPVPTALKDDAGDTGGTLQGRITCKKPAAQTFPPEIRNQIRSRWEGGSIVSLDLSQIELRVAALLSKDPVLVGEYQKAKPDLHTDRTIQTYGEDVLIKKYGPGFRSVTGFKEYERQGGKMINFADLFRASAERMQAQFLDMFGTVVPLPFFKSIVASRPTVRPGLWAWQEDLFKQAKSQGYLILPITGQSRQFGGGTDYEGNEIVNFPVQTTAGNVMLRIQAAVHTLLGPLGHAKILPFLNIYDALYFDCASPAHVQECLEICEAAVRHVADRDLWAILCERQGCSLPLQYETKVRPNPPLPFDPGVLEWPTRSPSKPKKPRPSSGPGSRPRKSPKKPVSPSVGSMPSPKSTTSRRTRKSRSEAGSGTASPNT